MKERVRHIQEYLQERRPEMVKFLKDLVRFETPSRDPEAQSHILTFIGKKLKELSYKVNIFPGKETGGFLMAMPLARKKGAPVQLLIGHCDTVWKRNTLSEMPIAEGVNKLSGPGIFDMKAGLTQMIFTLQAIEDLGLKLSVTPVLLINSDEEIGSRESTSAIRKLARIADRALILEPPLGLDGKLKTERKGIGRFTVTVRGKPAHAGLNPDKGVSAIVELSYQIQHLFGLNDFEKGITVNVGMIQGGSSANVIAEESSAVVDVRVSNKDDAKRIEKEIMSLRPKQAETEVLVEGYFGRPPMERTPRNRRLWSLARDMGDLLGIDLEEAAAGGGSDGNTTSQYTATLDGLGTTGDGAHARHEHIITEKLIERTALLTLLVMAESLVKESVKINEVET
ncbi:MAG: M20 family metallopeptidase [Lutimonas sp.]